MPRQFAGGGNEFATIAQRPRLVHEDDKALSDRVTKRSVSPWQRSASENVLADVRCCSLSSSHHWNSCWAVDRMGVSGFRIHGEKLSHAVCNGSGNVIQGFGKPLRVCQKIGVRRDDVLIKFATLLQH